MSSLATGITVTHGGVQLAWQSSGASVSFLLGACPATLLAMLAGAIFDPRLGVAAIVVSLPVVVYQVGLLTTASSRPAWPVVLAIGTFATTTAAVAVGSAVSLKRLQPHGKRQSPGRGSPAGDQFTIDPRCLAAVEFDVVVQDLVVEHGHPAGTTLAGRPHQPMVVPAAAMAFRGHRS